VGSTGVFSPLVLVGVFIFILFAAYSFGSKSQYSRLIRYSTDRNGHVTFAPEDTGQIGSELFDTNYSTSRIRPWGERRRQAFAVSQRYRGIF
jgi:hypothetical protein